MQSGIQFILASASPRRELLLRKAGYSFEIIPSDIDESSFDTEGVSPIEHTKQLALAKARDISARFGDHLVLGADTVVDFNGTIIGKPDDASHAEQITRTLFSSPHKVITGVAIVRTGDTISIVHADTTIVYPKKLADQQIAQHIRNGDWKGKAGAYGIQESGDEFVEKIDGSLTNVMGLPMELVTVLLDSLGVFPRKT